MDVKARIDAQEKALDRLLEWNRHADTKVQVFVAANLVLIGAVVANVPPPDKFNTWAFLLVVLGAACPAWSLFNCCNATAPMLDGPTNSLIFFSRIRELDAEVYGKQVEGRTDDEYLGDLNAQCHVNARIAHVKYCLLRDAAVWAFRSIPLTLISVYFLFRVW